MPTSMNTYFDLKPAKREILVRYGLVCRSMNKSVIMLNKGSDLPFRYRSSKPAGNSTVAAEQKFILFSI